MHQDAPTTAEMDAAYAGWKRSLVEEANRNRTSITEDFATVRRIVDGEDWEP